MKTSFRVVREGEYQGWVVLTSNALGTTMQKADGIPSFVSGVWFSPSQIEIKEFTDEPVRREEIVREVKVEVPVEREYTLEELHELDIGRGVIATARALARIKKARLELQWAQDAGRRAQDECSAATERMLNNLDMGDVLKETKAAMGFEDDEESTLGAECPECGETEFLDPDTGLCFDCKEANDEAPDQEECEQCGDDFDEDDVIDGLCPDCKEDFADDEDDEDDDED